MTSSRPPLERLTTGSPAFDRILGGGLPVRSVNVVAGEPGAGKTLFALQMLFHLARQGKKGIYFTTLSEPSLKLISYMQQFAFFDDALIDGKVIFADLGSVLRAKGIDATLEQITSRVEREEPAIIVIDSFKAVRDIIGDAAAVRTFAYDLAVQTAASGVTSLLVGEYTEAEIGSHSEFAIADGIIRFSNRRHELTTVREVEILKLRGADYAAGCHFLEIRPEGLTFFPRVRSPRDLPAAPIAPGDRVSTGIAGLDGLLDGGFPRASATIVQGGTGTGKTLLGLQFLLEGARRGEPGIHFTLEETPDQLRAISRGFGWDFPGLEARGLLALSYLSPVELSTDTFLDRVRRQVDEAGAKRVVLDSLTSLALGIPSDRRFKELVYSLTKHLRARGVTINMNVETAALLGTAELAGYGISFAADNVIQLKYVEVGADLERGISVLKARGVRHAMHVRRLSFNPTGLEVESSFETPRGVLTGVPVSPRKEKDP
jgi:circadian clock protein KaiC